MGFTDVRGIPGWIGPRPGNRSRADIIDGRAIAAKVREEVARDVLAFTIRSARRPGSATVLIGDDPVGALYVANKQTASREVGMESFHHHLPTSGIGLEATPPPVG
jgi:methylenetetrahydrofolate dehydrogenase (NADP+)/methenyltetrahydrofolate cyclohydrolase